MAATPPASKPAVVTKPEPKAEPLPEEVAAPKVPKFSSDGILLNPEDCNIGRDGVVTSKEG